MYIYFTTLTYARKKKRTIIVHVQNMSLSIFSDFCIVVSCYIVFSYRFQCVGCSSQFVIDFDRSLIIMKGDGMIFKSPSKRGSFTVLFVRHIMWVSYVQPLHIQMQYMCQLPTLTSPPNTSYLTLSLRIFMVFSYKLKDLQFFVR